jgi:hypothetical protein
MNSDSSLWERRMKTLSVAQQKLATLCTIEGYETLDQLIEAAALDSVSPTFVSPSCSDCLPVCISISHPTRRPSFCNKS